MILFNSANTVLVARPRDFCYNPETAGDNEFQGVVKGNPEEITRLANEEFEALVYALTSEGVEVLILEPPSDPDLKLPDAVFPNNWFSTHPDGRMFTYPMLAPNRQAERRIDDLEDLVRSNFYQLEGIHDISGATDEFLEGTGSLIFDHCHCAIYASLSKRCNSNLLDKLGNWFPKYELIKFESFSASELPIYHTNVVMTMGTRFAVICLEAVKDERQRAMLVERITEHRELIDITREQMSQHFCGNILELRNQFGTGVIFMSEAALLGFRDDQIEALSKYGKLVSVPVPTIQQIGGGSVRCMLGEIFLPRDYRAAAHGGGTSLIDPL